MLETPLAQVLGQKMIYEHLIEEHPCLENHPFFVVILQDEDFIPLTSPFLGDQTPTTNIDVEASTSQQLEQEESAHEDMNRGKIRKNIAHLIATDYRLLQI